MPTRYNHLFFDLDRTLWDFDTNSRLTLAMLYERHEMEPLLGVNFDGFLAHYQQVNDRLWASYRQGQIGKDHLRSTRFRQSFAHFGWDDADFSRQFDREYLEYCPRQTALIPGTRQVLDYLAGRYRLHIITNGFAQTQQLKLEQSALSPYFDKVFSSEAVGVNKPGAGIFITALRDCGAERNNSLMIGDSLVADVAGARSCGIDQVFFNPAGLAHDHRPTYEVDHLLRLRDFL